MRLLERDAALAALAEYAADARGGDGRVVLISGEAGVGKTALIEALQETEQARWLWGACEGSFTPRPLGPVYDVASQVGGCLEQVLDEDAPRHRIFRELLDELTKEQLTVLCLEDLHWADEATLDLLRFLTPRLKQAKALVLATYRDDALAPDDPLRMTLGELSTARAIRRIDLPPLSRTTVFQLGEERGIPGDDLFALTAGNPFLVCEVLETGTDTLPPSARDAVLARAARLDSHARATLDAAAVIGRHIDVALLRQVANCDAAAIDGCLTAGAVITEGGRFRFRHEIARRAVEEALPAHRRTELHKKVLDALEDSGSDNEARLAFHAEAAADAEAVLIHAPQAARQASALGAHREAATQYERALRFAGTDTRTRATLLTALGAERSLTDEWQDADDAQEEALKLWQELGDQLREGDLLRQMARTKWRLCKGEDAMAKAETAVQTLEKLPESLELGWAYAVLGAFTNGIGADSATYLSKAEAIAERFGDMPLLSNVVNSIGCGKTGLDGAPYLRRALQIALDADADAEAGRAFTNLQCILSQEYLLAESEQVYLEGMAYCEDHDIGTYEHCLRGAQAEVLERLGRYDEFDELMGYDLEERALSPINKISKLIVKGIVDNRRGRASAGPALEEALAYAEAGFEPAYIALVGLAQLEAAWLVGDAAGIRQEAKRVLATQDPLDPWYRGSFIAWLRRCGLHDLESELTKRDVAPPYEALLAGDHRAAAAQWRDLKVPHEEALALLDSGEAELMQQAIRILESLGATATVARAQALMRQHGHASIPRGARADTRANRFGLTRREQEVLALISQGLTNGDIAGRLFIAEKTVDNHVSNVLAKLNVGSRHDAAKVAAAI